jgi:hypothetical protein
MVRVSEVERWSTAVVRGAIAGDVVAGDGLGGWCGEADDQLGKGVGLAEVVSATRIRGAMDNDRS